MPKKVWQGNEMTQQQDTIDHALESADHWSQFKSNGDIDLAGKDFSGLDLSRYDFSKLDLENCAFQQSWLEQCDFSRSNLYGVDWSGADIRNCSFRGALLTTSSFAECEFVNCDFAGAEVSNVVTHETNFTACDLSRTRGLTQHFLDQSLGDSSTSIPQFLDYPDHWLLTEEEKNDKEWLRKLTSLRGNDVLLCNFDGKYLSKNEFATISRQEIQQTLSHIQKQLRYAIEDSVFHNESPPVFRSLNDYFLLVTKDAGRDKNGIPKPRWNKTLSEIEEISTGLQGNNLITMADACRAEIREAFPEKVATLDHIIHSHVLLMSGLPRWKSFLHGVGEANLDENMVENIAAHVEPICDLLEQSAECVDQELPSSIRYIKQFCDSPIKTAKIGAYAIVRSIESIFAALFSYCKKFVGLTAEKSLDVGPKLTVKLLMTGLMAAGAAHVFTMFPHLSTWLNGGLSVLRSLNII